MSDSAATVSVVIPAFNRRQYIAEAVDSVLNQTWPHVELIVTDDGSTDGTWEILCGYADAGRLTLLHHPERANRGQSASLNLAIERANGRYLAILDSDDVYEPNKFEVLVPFLESHPEYGLVYSDGVAIDAEGKVLYPMMPADHVEENDPNRMLLDCYFLLPQNALVRREVFDRAGRFEEAFRSAQDHDMLIRLMEVTKAAYLPDRLFRYRVHDDSISGKRQHVRWTTGFEILRRAAGRYPYRPATLRKRRAVLHYRMGSVRAQQGSWLKSIGHYLAAGALDPLRAVRVLGGADDSR